MHGRDERVSPLDEIRRFWDADAATYDRSPSHRPRSSAEIAAWTAALVGFLPHSPARVLDAGAGTGFLSLMAARLGHDVTALDLSSRMLEQLGSRAAAEGLAIDTVIGPAHEPPPGPFDAVVERHLIWTLPDPAGTLGAWREVAGVGRLVLFESLWGQATGPTQRIRAAARESARRLRRTPPDHHGKYADEVRRRLPLGGGTPPEHLIELATSAGWRAARLERLRSVEWAMARSATGLDRLLGVAPRFAVVAD